MGKRAKIDHMARQGLEAHPESTHKHDGEGNLVRRQDIQIIGRRSRKVWECSEGENCSVGLPIDLDEIYIEHAVGMYYHGGKTYRYHVACAINKQVVRPIEGAIDKGNSRRQAIHAQRARKAANAG